MPEHPLANSMGAVWFAVVDRQDLNNTERNHFPIPWYFDYASAIACHPKRLDVGPLTMPQTRQLVGRDQQFNSEHNRVASSFDSAWPFGKLGKSCTAATLSPSLPTMYFLQTVQNRACLVRFATNNN